jgi:2-hydroxyglutarate dehydrogenase
VQTDAEVVELSPGPPARVRTTAGEIDARLVVVCAGLQSDRVARMAGGARDPRIVPFRGDYWVLRPDRRSLVRGLVYPVPDPAFPFLGVHLTLRPDGEVWLGPTAVLTFRREGDRRHWFATRDAWEVVRHPGLYRLAARHLGTGLGEMLRSVRLRAVVAAAQALVPDVSEADLEPGPSGTRAQALGRDGKLVDDFVVERRPGVVLVRNAPSPAGTASLAIAELVADEALRGQ